MTSTHIVFDSEEKGLREHIVAEVNVSYGVSIGAAPVVRHGVEVLPGAEKMCPLNHRLQCSFLVIRSLVRVS